eukprot:TRINITY_DN5356_c0_g1_i2.p1 TRINITY_DN5356_c0_g1~~TRINITY_DN5356_c0_g1_i2.p1  ORF type:complete len:334 (-),score=107.56 TRINITY_DN5356_c0_g1_i2:41-1042(-)
MEVLLVNRGNLKDDFIFSVRAEDVKKMAPVSRCAGGKALKFQQDSLVGKAIKIDIMQTVSSAYLVPLPGKDKYQINFEDDFACEVKVQATGSSKAPSKAELPKEGAWNETASAAKEAKTYLESHKVPEVVQACLKTIIQQKPADPFQYMAKLFACGYQPMDEALPRAEKEGGREGVGQQPQPLQRTEADCREIVEEKYQPEQRADSVQEGFRESSGDAPQPEHRSEVDMPIGPTMPPISPKMRVEVQAAEGSRELHSLELGEAAAVAEAVLKAEESGNLERVLRTIAKASDVKAEEVLRDLEIARKEVAKGLYQGAINGTLQTLLADLQPTEE